MDSSSYLFVDCAVGCAGGSFNNNYDAVATSSTNGQSAAWLYGFNGATWDRLRDDSNKYLYVDVANSSLAVTGTFWQATQPVSGTFWQTTQPISGAISFTAPQHTIVDSGTVTAVTSITNALPAGTNVLGHVIADTGSTTAVTGNVTAVQTTGTNLHAVLDTTSTTAVTQATGTNLHAVLDTTSTTAVTQSTASNLNAAVVGTGTAGSPAGGVALMTKLLVTPDSVALPANQSVNISQINGAAPVLDPCQGQTKLFINISQTGNTKLVTGTSAKKIYICGISVPPQAAAVNLALVEGTGSTCGTSTVAIPGITGGDGTAAKGANMAINGGFMYGNGGYSIGQETTNADDMCLFQSGSGQVSGGLAYVVQ
jgi:hypothetical protein